MKIKQTNKTLPFPTDYIQAVSSSPTKPAVAAAKPAVAATTPAAASAAAAAAAAKSAVAAAKPAVAAAKPAVAAAKPAVASKPSSGPVYDFVAIAAYAGDTAEELKFKEGDKAVVLEKSDQGWWYVQINGKEGW